MYLFVPPSSYNLHPLPHLFHTSSLYAHRLPPVPDRRRPSRCPIDPQQSLQRSSCLVPLPTCYPPVPALSPLRTPRRSSSVTPRHTLSSQSILSQRHFHPQRDIYTADAVSTVSGLKPSQPHSPYPLHTDTQKASSTFFKDANNFRIEHQNIHVSHNAQKDTPSKSVFEYLEPYISYGASHNSDEGNDNPKCSPETREAIQAEFVGLVRDGDVYEQSKRMTWLSGPAGAGKSAIAGSVAATCERLGILAGTFFFSSVRGAGETRRTKRCVITTLAYQLARHKGLHKYKVQLLVAIEENPDVFRKCLQDQAQLLILGPLGAIHGKCDTSSWPRGILYDGLDEVQAIQYHNGAREDLVRKDEDDQNEILRVLHTLTASPVFPFRIFIASRPEDNIAYFFSTTARASSIRLFLDSKYEPDADIKRFLQSKFASLRHRSRVSNPSWPGEEVIDQLVEMSSGQFIVPSTILRYIESGLPQEQLEDIMRVAQGQMGNKNPFALLDAVYTHIINRSPNPQLAVIWIRHMITGVGLYDKKLPAHFWKKFLEDTDGQFYHLLKSLASLLSVPPYNDHLSPIGAYHKTLTDFMTSDGRCGDLYVGRKSLNEFVARRYVVILQNCGPKVPLPSPDKLPNFLKHLLSSSVLQGYGWSSEPSWVFAVFLQHLHEPSISALAACDVAWWTRFAISTVGLRSLLEGMYRYIHSWLRCTTRAGANDACLPACIHWREGILAEARTLGWLRRNPQIDWIEHAYQQTDRVGRWWTRSGHEVDACKTSSPSVQPRATDPRVDERRTGVLGWPYGRELAGLTLSSVVEEDGIRVVKGFLVIDAIEEVDVPRALREDFET
ncbi:hypothetical protein NMY22_g5210 [Coprinellus aureogranulatus]|nr:hypothetical protein NMY22_g5210 [Coprinellus aureogranulatus]